MFAGNLGDARAIVDPPGCHPDGLPIRPSFEETHIGGGELSTLTQTLRLCMPVAMPSANLRTAVLSQVLPLWRGALATHPEQYKFIFNNGRLVRKRALPSAAAVDLVQAWLPGAINAIRQDVLAISASLAAWDQVQAAVAGNGGNVEIATDNDEDDL